VEGANAEELLGYDDEDDEGEGDDDDEEVVASDEEAAASDEEASHTAFKQTTRVQAVRRAEGNRRIGGIRTQKAVVKDFNVSTFVSYSYSPSADRNLDVGMASHGTQAGRDKGQDH
jgi:hypothetical protein